jgi:hypothetical protein
MSAIREIQEIQRRVALFRSARPAHCKTGLGASRARKCKVVHRVRKLAAACTGERVRYYAEWDCGGESGDAVIVTDPTIGRFCKRCESLAQGPFVYRCYDAGDRLIYIGSAKSRLTRMHNHRANTPWWRDVVRVDYEDCPDIETARLAETAAIRAERPLRNKRGNEQSSDTA